MNRKPKYLDKERRKARAWREFWTGDKWSPTQMKAIEAQRQGKDFLAANYLAGQRRDFSVIPELKDPFGPHKRLNAFIDEFWRRP